MAIFTTSIPYDVSSYLRLQEYEETHSKSLLRWLCHSEYASELSDEWRDDKFKWLYEINRQASFSKMLVFDDISKRYIPDKYWDKSMTANFSRCEVYVDDSPTA